MGLKAYIAKRIVYSFLLVLFVITLNFIIFELMPGNPMELFMNPSRLKSQEQVDELMKIWGLDQPLHIRYFKYVINLLTFNFGISYISMDYVSKEIGERLLNTLLLVGTSTVLSIIIGIVLGVIAAAKRGTNADNFFVVTSLTTYSLPSFWIGMVLLIIFAHGLGWFPIKGTTSYTAMNPPPNIIADITDRMWHLCLPVVTLTLFSYGGWVLLTRAVMLEALTEDYIVTARAKGLAERTVLYRHALKNASLPIITSAAISFGFLLTGAIITEQVFNYPGLGMWIWKAINFSDYPVLQAIFYIVALCVIIANFIADLLYGVIDPRIKYE